MTQTKEQLEAEAKAKADAEAKAKADEEARIAGEGSSEDDDDEGDSSSKKIDYKKLAEEEKAKREAAERLIAEKKFKKKHKDEDEEDEEEDDDEDKPITRKEFQKTLEIERQKAKKEAQADQAREIALEMSETTEEAEYVLEVFQNRQFPSYIPLREQVEEAYAIANRKKLISTNSELKRALKGKDAASKDAANTQRDGQRGTAPKLSAQDEALYKRNGFEYNATDKVWQKKLPNGKLLVKNPVTKQSYIK